MADFRRVRRPPCKISSLVPSLLSDITNHAFIALSLLAEVSILSHSILAKYLRIVCQAVRWPGPDAWS